MLTPEQYEQLLAAAATLAGAETIEAFAQTLLARSLEFSSAQRAFLIFDQDGAWTVAAGAERAPFAFRHYSGMALSAAQESNLFAVGAVIQAIRSRRTYFDTIAPVASPPAAAAAQSSEKMPRKLEKEPPPNFTELPAERPAAQPAAQPAEKLSEKVMDCSGKLLPEKAAAKLAEDEPECAAKKTSPVLVAKPAEPAVILCAPLLHQGKVSAVLYLEKPGPAFAPAAVQLVARLIHQAAPRLYSLLEMGRLAELFQLRREMTEALRASEERFRSIFNSSPVMIFFTDIEGRLLMVNDYWLQSLGYSRVEVVSRPLNDFCTPAGRAVLAQQFQPQPQVGQQYENLPVQFVRRNGALLDALVSGVVLHSEVEGFNQCLSFAIDMTAHRRAEQELDRYRRRLEELVRERTHELSAANRQLEQDILRRTAAESQLLRSQQFLQAALDALSEKLAILDANGAIVALNSSWHEYSNPGVPAAGTKGLRLAAEGSPAAPPARSFDAQTAAYWNGYQIGADYLTALRGGADTAHHPTDAQKNKRPKNSPFDDTFSSPPALPTGPPLSIFPAMPTAEYAPKDSENDWPVAPQESSPDFSDTASAGLTLRDSVLAADVVVEVMQGLADLQSGRRNFFHTLYQLQPPAAQSTGLSSDQTGEKTEAAERTQTWYSLRAIRFQSGGETYIAIAHDDITDRKQAEAALLEAAAVNERHRLARELHDSVTQALYSMALFVDATRLALSAGQIARATDNLGELRAMSRAAMENMRALIFELHPPELAEIGLIGALREYLKNFQHRTQINVDFHISGEEHAFPVRTESELYRVAQEALSNCFKHARADQVAVTLHYQDWGLEMSIQDNGLGFQTDLAHLNGGMGLRGMRERMRFIGGRLEINSAPNQGAQIRVEMAYTGMIESKADIQRKNAL